MATAYQSMPTTVKSLDPSLAPSTPTQQADALKNPAPVTANTPVDQMQKSAYESAAGYESGLAAGTNEEIKRELGRARDEISVGMEKEGEAAMARGADPSLFRSRALEAGKRNIGALQGQLADVALGRRAQAIGLKTGAAGEAAGTRNALHLGTLAQRTADQRALVEQAEAQARLQEAPYNRMMQMMQSMGSLTDKFGAFSGTGGAAGGVGPAGAGGVTQVGIGSNTRGSGGVWGAGTQDRAAGGNTRLGRNYAGLGRA